MTPFREMRLAGILQDRDPACPRHFKNEIHVCNGAADVNRQDTARPFCDCGFNFRGVHLHRFAVAVDKDREGVLKQHNINCGNESVRRDQHFVARTDAERIQRGKESAGSTGRGNAVAGTELGRPAFLELIDSRPAQAVPASRT